jgi:hypothetical protein
MNVVFGAGKFSHVHLKVLYENNIKKVILVKKTSWTNLQKQMFMQKHPMMDIVFEDDAKTVDNIVHIVTPSESHAQLLYKNKKAKKIFVEKPAVLFNEHDDFVLTNTVKALTTSGQLLVYQNDWLAQVQTYRTNQKKPKFLEFTYDVKNPNTIDPVTETGSHAIILLSKWCKPDCAIKLQDLSVEGQRTKLSFIANDIQIVINMSNGLRTESDWSMKIDNEVFNREQLGHTLMSNTMKTMLTNTKPMTDWYDSSWLIHKIRLINKQELFKKHMDTYYSNG